MKKSALLLFAFVVVSPALANEAHNQLQGMTESQRQRFLTTYMQGSDEPCNVNRTFFQGSDDKGNANWNVGCSNGKAFAIHIKNDAEGSTSILSCAMLKYVAKIECFKKFSNQR